MDHINAYTLAELTAGVKVHTDTAFRWDREVGVGRNQWLFTAIVSDTQGDTMIQMAKWASFPYSVNLYTPYVNGRRCYLSSPESVTRLVVESLNEVAMEEAVTIGRLFGATYVHAMQFWHTDRWPRCNGVFTNGVRIVQKHLMPPWLDDSMSGGKCKHCRSAYRSVRRDMSISAPGYPLGNNMRTLTMELDAAHVMAYKYPLKPLTVYREDPNRRNNK